MTFVWIGLALLACITLVWCTKIKSNAAKRVSDNDTWLRELELMTPEQRELALDKKVVKPAPKKKVSPYGIERTMAKNGQWGYSLTKNGEIIKSSAGHYEVWFQIHHARNLVHEMERNDGCELSKF